MLTKPTPTAAVMIVTPEMAAKWLARNTKNRKMSSRSVEEYARSMTEGRWRLNGETIKIGANGNLLDGQNRLQGCVKSGCSFESYVVFGIDPDTFDTMDRGRIRTAGHIIGIEGYRNSNAVAAAVRWVLAIRRRTTSNKAVVTPDEIRLFLAVEPALEESVSRVLVAKRVIAPALAGALHYLFSTVDQTKADEFFVDLAGGIGLSAGDAVLVLRERLIKAKLLKNRLNDSEVCALAIRAWNRRRKNADTVTLKGTITNEHGRLIPEIE